MCFSYTLLQKQVFSTSKSTGALDKLPAYQQLKERIEGKNAEQQSDQLDKTPSNVRKTRLAFESSQLKVICLLSVMFVMSVFYGFTYVTRTLRITSSTPHWVPP